LSLGLGWAGLGWAGLGWAALRRGGLETTKGAWMPSAPGSLLFVDLVGKASARVDYRTKEPFLG
jgi:hypothetical protein